jgi:hypothetical protein
MSMNRQDFVRELKAVQHLFEWKLVPDNAWSADRRGEYRFHIRATIRNTTTTTVFDLIGAVCYARTGFLFDERRWFDAAAALRLDEVDAWDIMAAGNDLTWRRFAESRIPVSRIQDLRNELASLVGLEVNVQSPA